MSGVLGVVEGFHASIFAGREEMWLKVVEKGVGWGQ